MLLLFVLLISCNKKKSGEVKLASAYEFTLYQSDLESVMPKKISKSDSIIFVQNYINHWLQERTLIHFSKSNIDDDELHLDKQIEDYKNSLLIYSYQKKFIEQKLDTLIYDKEIEDYYNAHNQDFQLKDNIVKVAFLKMDKRSKNLKEARKLLKEFNESNKNKISDLAERYADNYFLDNNAWILFDDLLKEIPIQTYNQEEFLRNNTFVELTDSLYTTFVKISGFKTKESVSPLSFEYERIRMIILSKRKQELLKKLEADIFKEAQESGSTHIY